MKRTWILVTVAVLLFARLVSVMLFSEPVRPRLEYYSEDSNYITAAGTVSHIAYGDDREYVYLAFEEIPDRFEDTSFKIEGENLRILLENGFADKVTLGAAVEYVSAPRIFWDGYSMPVVALSVDGEPLLTFEEGKANLLEMIRN